MMCNNTYCYEIDSFFINTSHYTWLITDEQYRLLFHENVREFPIDENYINSIVDRYSNINFNTYSATIKYFNENTPPFGVIIGAVEEALEVLDINIIRKIKTQNICAIVTNDDKTGIIICNTGKSCSVDLNDFDAIGIHEQEINDGYTSEIMKNVVAYVFLSIRHC